MSYIPSKQLAYSDIENIRTAMNRGAFDFLTSRSIFKI